MSEEGVVSSTSDIFSLGRARPSFSWRRLLKRIALPSVLIAVIGWDVGLLNFVHNPTAAIAFVLFLSGLFMLHWLRARRLSEQKLPPLTLKNRTLIVPARPYGQEIEELPISDVAALDVRGTRSESHLVLAGHDRTYVLPLSTFHDSDAPSQLADALRERLEGLVDGQTTLRRIAQHEQTSRALYRRPISVTRGLLGILTGVFVAQLFHGVTAGSISIVRWGANVPSLVSAGEYWRLVVSNYLHGFTLHLALNGLALFVLGAWAERLLGSWRFLMVYVCSGVGGSLLSSLLRQGLFSLGASTSIFGVMGALAIINWRYRNALPIGFRQSNDWWFFVIGLNFLLPLFLPVLDAGAHIGGFLVGAFVAYIFAQDRSPRVLWERPDLGLKVGGGIAVFVTLLAAGYAVAEGQKPASALTKLTPEQLSLVEGNGFAWLIAVEPKSQRTDLEWAKRAANVVVDAQPKESAFIDTLAMVQFRLGAVDEAIRLEREALMLAQAEIYFSQLGLFLSQKIMPTELTPASGNTWTLPYPGGAEQQHHYVVCFHDDMLYGMMDFAGRFAPAMQQVTLPDDWPSEGVTCGLAKSFPELDRNASNQWRFHTLTPAYVLR